jgi:hypothetical protein
MCYELFFSQGEKRGLWGWFWGVFGDLKSEWREKMDVISTGNWGKCTQMIQI